MHLINHLFPKIRSTEIKLYATSPLFFVCDRTGKVFTHHLFGEIFWTYHLHIDKKLPVYGWQNGRFSALTYPSARIQQVYCTEGRTVIRSVTSTEEYEQLDGSKDMISPCRSDLWWSGKGESDSSDPHASEEDHWSASGHSSRWRRRRPRPRTAWIQRSHHPSNWSSQGAEGWKVRKSNQHPSSEDCCPAGCGEAATEATCGACSVRALCLMIFVTVNHGLVMMEPKIWGVQLRWTTDLHDFIGAERSVDHASSFDQWHWLQWHAIDIPTFSDGFRCFCTLWTLLYCKLQSNTQLSDLSPLFAYVLL